MNIFIIEDETPALNRLQKLVRETMHEAHIAGSADSITSAVEWFKNNPMPDLCLMDIELADGQSFEIFNRVEIKCPVIFTTAYDEYALKAFKVNSIDYLLKPVDKDELKKAMDKFGKIYQRQLETDYSLKLSELLSNIKQQSQGYKTRFLIRSGTKLVPVSTDEIAYFMAQDKMVYLVTHQNQKYIVDHTLDELSALLDPLFFFHLNRQFISSFTSIASIHTYFNGKLKIELKPKITEEVLVSRERTAVFKDWLNR